MTGRDTYDMFSDPDRGRFGDNESSDIRGNDSVRSDLVDLTLTLQQDRPLALMVTDPAKPGMRWISLPKSLIEYEKLGQGVVKVTIPERFAKAKGLI